MSKRIVVSQPMVFPWAGIFEQVRLADVFVHYDDVQLPQGRSFMTRVQIKGPGGVQWLSVPVRRGAKLIKDAQVDDAQDWRGKHLRTLAQNYAKAPFRDEMMEIAQRSYALPTASLSEINCHALETVAAYFSLKPRFLRSSALDIGASSSERLLQIVRALEGSTYITGHGAAAYLDHELFERNAIAVEYMDYRKLPYPQLHGEFTPFVSILDLIANTGRAGAAQLASGTRGWREHLA